MNSAAGPLVAAQSFDEAARFLSALDPTADVFQFRTFGDVAKRAGKKLSGSLSEVFGALAERNAAGDGVFVVVNEGGQTADSITRIRGVFLDLDGAPVEAVQRFSLVPHVAVESSPGRFHAYWRTDGLALGEFADLQRAIAAQFGGDKTINDLSRVMRLPGFLHHKREPFASRIVHVSDAAPYSADVIRRTFRSAGPAAVLPAPFNPGPIAGELDVPAVRAALAYLDAADPALWRSAMTALRGYGALGWELLDQWSRTAPAVYSEAGNTAVWAKATPLDGGQRVIFAAAQAKGWANTVASALPPAWKMPAGTSPIVTFRRIGEIGATQRRYVVQYWIPANSFVAIIGPSGAAKSFAALGIAFAIVTGTPFFDCEVEQGSVFYIAGEGQSGLKHRSQAWTLETGISLDDAPLWIADGLPAITEPENVAAIIAAIQALLGQHGAPKLIVIDTLHRGFGSADENSASAMSLFIAGIDRIKAELSGATVLVIHHTGHDTSRARGSSSFFAALDACVMMKRDDNGRIQFNQHKLKDGEPAVPMLLELMKVDLPDGDSSAVLRLPPASPADQVKEAAIAQYINARNADGSYQYNGKEAEIMLKSFGIELSKASINRRRKANDKGQLT